MAVIGDLANRIEPVRRPNPVRVAIDGVDAAGKTTLADELAPVLRRRGREVVRASIDGFHRPRAERYRRGELSPEGTIATRSTTTPYAARFSIRSARTEAGSTGAPSSQKRGPSRRQ